jgi:hypothetical protein
MRSSSVFVPLFLPAFVFPGVAAAQAGPSEYGIGDPAYSLLNARAVAHRQTAFVNRDADSGLNRGFPVGFFGSISKIQVQAACLDEAQSSTSWHASRLGDPSVAPGPMANYACPERGCSALYPATALPRRDVSASTY